MAQPAAAGSGARRDVEAPLLPPQHGSAAEEQEQILRWGLLSFAFAALLGVRCAMCCVHAC